MLPAFKRRSAAGRPPAYPMRRVLQFRQHGAALHARDAAGEGPQLTPALAIAGAFQGGWSTSWARGCGWELQLQGVLRCARSRVEAEYTSSRCTAFSFSFVCHRVIPAACGQMLMRRVWPNKSSLVRICSMCLMHAFQSGRRRQWRFTFPPFRA